MPYIDLIKDQSYRHCEGLLLMVLSIIMKKVTSSKNIIVPKFDTKLANINALFPTKATKKPEPLSISAALTFRPI